MGLVKQLSKRLLHQWPISLVHRSIQMNLDVVKKDRTLRSFQCNEMHRWEKCHTRICRVAYGCLHLRWQKQRCENRHDKEDSHRTMWALFVVHVFKRSALNPPLEGWVQTLLDVPLSTWFETHWGQSCGDIIVSVLNPPTPICCLRMFSWLSLSGLSL